ncbi:MAG: PD40 domain-containing protein [Acidobacteria bacterium]|nr:PD40 domain-containing protein [Acidobacteriota bacterium]
MSRLLVLFLTVPIVVGAQGNAPAPAPLASFGEPGISPDGATIAFVSGGDIWDVPARGGEARLLIAHPANDSRPMYSPDGTRLAFSSTRTGNGDIYLFTIATGDLRRLTFDDAAEAMNGWSADGGWIYFSSRSHDLGSMEDVARVSVDGGTPLRVAADRYATEYFAAPGPDGGTVAITARGFAGSQWWRNGRSHLDESEIWLVRPGNGAPEYQPVTAGGAKDVWPMWAPDGRTLYFMSDRGGAQNIWTLPPGGVAKAVTGFQDGRVLWPTISRDGQTIAFERDFGVWTVDTSSGRAREVSITLRGAPAAEAVEHRTFTDRIQELALSPDGRKIAFAVHGEIFSAAAKDGGDAVRLTDTPGEEYGLAWAPDSRRLVYVSDRDGADHLYAYDFGSERETQLTSGAARDHAPLFSPDGRWIAFERGNRELRVLDPATRQERLVASATLNAPRNGTPLEFQWSPDSRHLAMITTGAKSFQNVSIAPVDSAGDLRPVSFLANTNGGSLAWSPDGTYLTYVTSQRTEPGQVIRVDLVPRTPKFQEDQFRDLFKEESPSRPDAPRPTTPGAPSARSGAADAAAPERDRAGAAPESARAPVEIVYDDIRRRASALPVGLDVNQQIISPDGKTMLLRATAADQENLYVYPLDELSREPAIARQLTSTPGGKQSPQFTPDGKEVVYLDRGRIFTVTIDRRETRPIAVTAELDVDFAREKIEVFREAWSALRDQFNDEAMNGVDWNAVRARYEPRVAGARTGDEMRRIISLMLGELNASHMGISAPAGSAETTLGRLAVDFDRAEYERSGRLRLTDVVPLGPAALAGVRTGEYVVSVDGAPIDRTVNLDERLDHTIGRRVLLGVAATASARPREVEVKPVNQTTERGLRYRQWVEQRRAYVANASGGRLGYAHMLDMSAGALAQLQIDLDAENHARDGVVVDVRNNNGGFVNVYALDILTRRGYFDMARRGLPIPPVSSRTLLGQRALERPTILVTNQHSLSDAEDFTEGYRTLKLGKVVGEPTAGWIIYTGSVTLIDGSSLRMPSTKIFGADGTPMEMHPRPVDLPVKRPMGESYSGRDSQLDAAVAELLKQLGGTSQ